jgi:hypothetical protein
VHRNTTIFDGNTGIVSTNPTVLEKKDGFGDLVAGLKYKFWTSEKTPLVATAGVNVKFQTADVNKEGSGDTVIAPYIAVSSTISTNIKPYAAYTLGISDRDGISFHQIQTGVQYELNRLFTVKPRLRATFYSSSEALSRYESYSVGVESYLQVMRNFYILPVVAVGTNTRTSTQYTRRTDYDRATFVEAGLGFYYYYD